MNDLSEMGKETFNQDHTSANARGQLQGNTHIEIQIHFQPFLGLKLWCFRAVDTLEMVYSQREHSST